MSNVAPVMSDLSLVSKVGVMLYVLVALWAGVSALRLRRPQGGGRGLWLGIAGTMVALAAWRASMAEPRLLFWVRSLARARGDYETRQAIQAPTLATFLIAFGALLYFGLRTRNVTPRFLAAMSAGALLALVAIRLVSLHAMDDLLYARVGPFNVNQLLEAALLATIALSASLEWTQMKRTTSR